MSKATQAESGATETVKDTFHCFGHSLPQAKPPRHANSSGTPSAKPAIFLHESSLLFARVKPPFMQEMHRSACAVFERVQNEVPSSKHNTNTNQNQTTTDQGRKQETLVCTCRVKQMRHKTGVELLQNGHLMSLEPSRSC